MSWLDAEDAWIAFSVICASAAALLTFPDVAVLTVLSVVLLSYAAVIAFLRALR